MKEGSMRFLFASIAVGTLVAFVFMSESLFKIGLISIALLSIFLLLMFQLKRSKKKMNVINGAGYDLPSSP